MTFSENVNGLKFSCHVDAHNNPFQDCLNAMAYLCSPATTTAHRSNVVRCRNAVDRMVQRMNQDWQAVRRECGQWSWNGHKGSWNSPACAAANHALSVSGFAYYVAFDGRRIAVTPELTNSVSSGLWSNTALVE